MPKMKTNRGAAKRFKPIAGGRFKFRQGYRNHILTKKSSKRKRQLGPMHVVHSSDQAAVQQMLPYA